MTFEEMRHRLTAASVLGLLLVASPGDARTAAAEDAAIRPFRIRIPNAELVELRRRIIATRWPEKATVADESQGVPLAMVRELAHYWASEYKGGHFAAWEQPQLFAAEVRAAFRSLH